MFTVEGLTKEEVLKMRMAIRKAFKGFKVSVTLDGHTAVRVMFIDGPQEPDLKLAESIVDSIKPKVRVYEDSDYGWIPNYYRTIEKSYPASDVGEAIAKAIDEGWQVKCGAYTVVEGVVFFQLVLTK